MKLNNYIGNKAFYKKILMVAVPIMVESGISNFVNLLDNVMVGRIGTEQMSAVSIVNQLIFVYSLCVIGGVEGLSIFTAQFFGKNDHDGIQATFRAKLWLSGGVSFAAFTILILWGPELIGFYLNEGSEAGDLAAAQGYAEQYLHIIFLSFPAFMFIQVYGSTLKACGKTVIPMRASIVAVLTNLVLNYLLIYGMNPNGLAIIPPMGVKGAAIATVISRYTEMIILVIWPHRHHNQAPYIRGVYKTLKVPCKLIGRFARTGAPVLINETLWSMGMSMLLQCYSLRGLDVVAAFNISGTITNLFSIVFFSMGDAVAIIVGQLLGAGKQHEAMDTDRKIFVFALFFSALTGIMLLSVSGLFPGIYNTDEGIKLLASQLICVYAAFCPMIALCHCSYFTLRCGGRTIISFLFDSAFTWTVSVPVAFVLSRVTDLDAVLIYLCVTGADLLKMMLGLALVKKGIWLNNLTE